MTPPSVTILLTVYQRTQFIAEALEGALNQDFGNFEVHVLDDSNSAEIRSIVGRYSDLRVKYLPNERRMGVIGSLKLNLSALRSEFVAILNDDDVWEPTFLSRIIAEMRLHNAALGFSDHWIIDEQGRLLVDETNENSRRYGRSELTTGSIANLAELVLYKNSVPLAMAAVVQRSAIPSELLDEQVAGAYDYWISLLLASRGVTAVYVGERLSRYRVHGNMETVRRSADKLDIDVYLYRKAIELDLFPAQRNRLRALLWSALVQSGIESLRFGNRSRSLGYTIQSFRFGISLKSIAALLCCFAPAMIVRRILDRG